MSLFEQKRELYVHTFLILMGFEVSPSVKGALELKTVGMLNDLVSTPVDEGSFIVDSDSDSELTASISATDC
jgi:hypothetical protein